MRAAEEAAISRGISAEVLMEQAGGRIARQIAKFFRLGGRCLVYGGKGHNAGDAFVAARWLARAGWEVDVRLAFAEKELSELTARKLTEMRQSCRDRQERLPDRLTIVLDGLLGLGAKPPLREPIRSACREINSLRASACIVAIDLPSGMDGDSGKADRDCVVADFTATVGFAKRGLVADSAVDLVGRLEVIPLDDFPLVAGRAEARLSEVATAESLRDLLPRRKFSAYKNQFGRIGIVAGSRGFTGAALMCSLGALRAGAGLVELFVPEEIYEIVAAAAAPEVMVKPIKSYADIIDEPIDVWAVGPGLGKSRAHEVLELIREAKQPMVVDADGLNILAEKIDVLSQCRGPRLLTPHPGEMKRLFKSKKASRAEIAMKFCGEYAVTLLLKGSRTIVGQAGHALSYNTTGNPGMATGGMGDVLTGVCAALMGQRLTPYNSARLGAWLCGRAAELAIFAGNASEESLLPRDLLQNIGAAFTQLRLSPDSL
jgi:hydroxyethylthiazole kinase-like uncharacterized protein yjeF